MNPHLPPLRLRFADDGARLVADWRDGHSSAYPLSYLRGWCPCALCQGHGVTARFVPNDGPAVAGLHLVGSYAVTIEWKGGHSTGIYTWERLRELCPCPACGGPEEGTPVEGAPVASDERSA